MTIEYEAALYEGTLYVNDNEISTPEQLVNPSLENNVYVVLANRYHFYETPWEKDDKFDVKISLDGKSFSSWGWFRNKTRTIVIKGNLKEI
jgi:hypothetical protein